MSEVITNINRFRASAKAYEDLSLCEEPEIKGQYKAEDFIGERVPAGLVYCGGLVIEDWKHAPLEGNRYYLVIGNQEYLSNDLAPLEEALFEWHLTEYLN